MPIYRVTHKPSVALPYTSELEVYRLLYQLAPPIAALFTVREYDDDGDLVGTKTGDVWLAEQTVKQLPGEPEVKEGVFEVFVRILNEAFELDPAAVHALLCNRVPCNERLADHPTIQVSENPVLSDGSCHVGMLGILNGVCEALTGRRIAARWNMDMKDDSASFTGFAEYVPSKEEGLEP